MAVSGLCGITLKRKVLSAETKLFEWHPCICTIVADHGTLLLLLQPPARDESDDGQIEEDDGEAETMTIDLASQLIEVRPKKSKVRCELEYYASTTADASRDISVRTEELMAPSAAVCQRWMTQLRQDQQQAQQLRKSSSNSSVRSTAPSPVAPLPSSSSGAPPSVVKPSVVKHTNVQEPVNLEKLHPVAVATSPVPQSASSSSSMTSSAISFTMSERLAAVAAAASYRVHKSCEPVVDECEIDTVDTSSTSLTPASESLPHPVSTSVSSVSSSESTSAIRRVPRTRDNTIYSSGSESSSSSESGFIRTPRRRSQRFEPSVYEDENNEHDSEDNRRLLRHRRRIFHPKAAVSIPRHPQRLDGGGFKPSASSSSRLSPRLLSSRTRRSQSSYIDLPLSFPDDEVTPYEGDGDSSRAELHILQRVEAALRELELENAQAKARERELNQEVQSLRDAARVASAERKHAEQECRHARREVDAWRRATQSAEAAAAQLQEQLGIAREENQLLAGEKLRLKRQNSELLTQVHRLDSLVYGRF